MENNAGSKWKKLIQNESSESKISRFSSTVLVDYSFLTFLVILTSLVILKKLIYLIQFDSLLFANFAPNAIESNESMNQ